MKPIANQALSYAKQHPYVALTFAGGLFGVTGYGLYTLQDRKLDISANRWKIDPAHDAQIRVGNVTSKEGSSTLRSRGQSPSIQAGDIASGQDSTIVADKADSKPPQFRK